MKKSILLIILSILFFSTNAFADMVASDVDMSPAIADTTIVVLIVLNVLVFLFGYKKVLHLLGK